MWTRDTLSLLCRHTDTTRPHVRRQNYDTQFRAANNIRARRFNRWKSLTERRAVFHVLPKRANESRSIETNGIDCARVIATWWRLRARELWRTRYKVWAKLYASDHDPYRNSRAFIWAMGANTNWLSRPNHASILFAYKSRNDVRNNWKFQKDAKRHQSKKQTRFECVKFENRASHVMVALQPIRLIYVNFDRTNVLVEQKWVKTDSWECLSRSKIERREHSLARDIYKPQIACCHSIATQLISFKS